MGFYNLKSFTFHNAATKMIKPRIPPIVLTAIIQGSTGFSGTSSVKTIVFN